MEVTLSRLMIKGNPHSNVPRFYCHENPPREHGEEERGGGERRQDVRDCSQGKGLRPVREREGSKRRWRRREMKMCLRQKGRQVGDKERWGERGD